jgi:hypothetical protein
MNFLLFLNKKSEQMEIFIFKYNFKGKKRLQIEILKYVK